MLKRIKIRKLSDYFAGLDGRQDKGIYFYRLNGYSQEIEEFIRKYYDLARKSGVIIEGKIPNPDEKNLSYYGEIMGMDFQMSLGFIEASLRKWLPRMKDNQRRNVATAIYDCLDSLRKAGKTENMLKNAYIKFMCWLYYKFERIVNQLGANDVPKILYEGDISNYELMLISILSNAGCDVVLLQYHGDAGYLKADPSSALSDNLQMDGMKAFPPGFCLKKVREDLQNELNNQRLYGTKPELLNCTNAWIRGEGLDDVRESVLARGSDPKLFYNCFIRINGVEDKLTYTNELYQLQLALKNAKRKVVIVNQEIGRPTPEEIAGIRRNQYSRQDQMIMDLSANIIYASNTELQRLMVKSFVDVVLMEAKSEGSSLNKLTNKAVYLLCWLKRYMPMLFSNWTPPEVACFIYLGGCKNENECMFLRFLARLPVDVLVLCPNLNQKCMLTDSILYEVNFGESLVLDKFPGESSQVTMATAAYHAERELDTLMYQDSGLYRDQQYGRANIISLQTMYEEIKILWDQELKYRPGFSTVDGVVNVPVIFSKVSGVKHGQLPQYWTSIRELLTEDTILIQKAPYIEPTAANPVKSYAAEFYKNGRLLKAKIKDHACYKYGILREDMQEFMLDKLQAIIEQKVIKGIGQNGTEYTVIATALNLPQNIVRMIQKFDFTKKNPKLIYINTTETVISLEDSILAAFLNQIGFDIVFFVPTGYQSIEKYFNKKIMEEHQIGEYIYDLQVPDLHSLPLRSTRQSWRDIIFKRGN